MHDTAQWFSCLLSHRMLSYVYRENIARKGQWFPMATHAHRLSCT